MANFDTLIVSASPQVYVRLQLAESSYDVNANTSSIYWEIDSITNGGSRSGTWDWNTNISGNVYSGSVGGTHSGTQGISSGYVTIGHDANGNGSMGGSAYLDAFYGNGTSSGSIGLTRLPLAPPITSIIADTIKPTTARLGLEIGGYGHGTSTSMYMQYRKLGDTSWIGTPAQADAAGYNYWTITALKPGTVYEYRGVAYNNNGDQSISGVQTLKSLAVPGMIPLLMALL
jgi:hypothetical protein